MSTKPPESLATSGGSQSVRGLAPIIRKRLLALTVSSAPESQARSTR